MDDMAIHAAQILLTKLDIGAVGGLMNPLLLNTWWEPPALPFVQIFNQNGSHWVVASTIGCNAGCVRLYDSSLRKETCEATKKILFMLVQTTGSLTVDVMNVQQQEGGSDCGLFAIAFATSLVFGQCPTLWRYTQKSMRKHLMDCLEKKDICPFPSRAVNRKYHNAVLHTLNVE